MEAETGDSNRKSLKRPPLANLTNHSTARRKLSSPPPPTKPSKPKPSPISRKSKAKSVNQGTSVSKLANPGASSSFEPENVVRSSSESASDVFSSSVQNPRRVPQLTTAPPNLRSRSASTDSSNGIDGIFEPRVVYCRRNTADPSAYSCPPLVRKLWNELNKAEDSQPSKSHIDLDQKPKKKKHPSKKRGVNLDDASKKNWGFDFDPDYALPRDFVEQQRAYFKEIDEFELLEEEISDDEKDKV